MRRDVGRDMGFLGADSDEADSATLNHSPPGVVDWRGSFTASIVGGLRKRAAQFLDSLPFSKNLFSCVGCHCSVIQRARVAARATKVPTPFSGASARRSRGSVQLPSLLICV